MMMCEVADGFGRQLKIDASTNNETPRDATELGMAHKNYMGPNSNPEEYVVTEFLENDILQNDVEEFEQIKIKYKPAAEKEENKDEKEKEEEKEID